MRTWILLAVFALSATTPSSAVHSRRLHAEAQLLMEQARQTTNPIRLFLLAHAMKRKLEEAEQLDPEDVGIRLDLVRFHAVTPVIAGGNLDTARAEAAAIARRDPPLGHFARGYLAYRKKEYGVGRLELREAVRTARDDATRALALRWLGWLSQESQQYADAFAAFEQLRPLDASALFEIGRTAAFCSCQLERGRSALEQYLSARRTPQMPSLAAAHYQLALVLEHGGDFARASREIDLARRLDASLPGVDDARERIRSRSAAR